MSVLTLAQYEPYLKSLEDCLKEISRRHLEMRQYIHTSHKHLHTLQAKMGNVDRSINQCQAGVFMLIALVNELRSKEERV